LVSLFEYLRKALAGVCIITPKEIASLLTETLTKVKAKLNKSYEQHYCLLIIVTSNTNKLSTMALLQSRSLRKFNIAI